MLGLSNREVIAFAIIAVMVLGGAGLWLIGRRKRKIRKLRMRGIKTHGH